MIRRAWRRWRLPASTFVGLSLLLIALQHVSNRVLRDAGYRLLPWQGARFYLDGWSQFDGPSYEKIATVGYSYVPGERSLIVWFPLYPMMMRAVDRLVGDMVLAGVLVSLAMGLVASIAFWELLTALRIEGRARTTAFLVLALYPYGWYLYGVVYADATFLAFLIAAFLLIERRRPVLAGLVGALATASRPTGMALLPGLFLLNLQREGILSLPDHARGLRARFAIPSVVDRAKVRAATFGPLLAAGGLGSYMVFLWANWGSPFIFILNERTYHPEDKPILKFAFFYRWFNFADDPTYALTIGAQAIITLGVLAAVPAVCRRFGFAYGAYLAVLVAIPTVSTEDFMGTGRYLMAAFPAAALAGEHLAARTEGRRSRGHAVLLASGALMVFLAFGFSRSWYLS